MKKLIYGFFMAWGMFLSIPCPFPKWDENAKRQMLCCLPVIGCIVGGIWAGACFLLYKAQFIPSPVRAVILSALPWLLTGFMHLDGFMDVCDAVLSRRDLETKRRILKDSHCGAFAVICTVLLILLQWSLFYSIDDCSNGLLLPLALIPPAVRSVCALSVLTLRPMQSSQYSGTAHNKKSVFAVSLMLAALTIPIAVFAGKIGFSAFAPLVSAIACSAAVRHGYKQLDGMSGDISGFALTIGELAGAATLVLLKF